MSASLSSEPAAANPAPLRVLFIGPPHMLAEVSRRAASSPALDRVTALPARDCDSSNEPLQRALASWRGLRERTRAGTRLNSPEAFCQRLADGPAPGEGDDCALILCDAQGARAVLVAQLRRGFRPRRYGPRDLTTLRLRTLSLAYSQLLHDGSPEACQWARDLLTRWLAAGVVDQVEVLGIERGGPLHSALREAERVRRLEFPVLRWHTSLLDPVTRERTHHNSGRTRRKFRARDRRLAEEFGGELRLLSVTQPAQVGEFVRSAATIVRETYQAAIGVGVREDRQLERYLSELASAGTLRGYLLLGGGAPIAYALGDVQFGVFSLWATAYTPRHAKHSPGVTLLLRAMDELADEGVERFDFGAGDADYKRILGSDCVEQLDLALYADRMLPALARGVDAALRWASELLTRYPEARQFLRRLWRPAKD